MSTVISYSSKHKKELIKIHATESRVIIVETDITGRVIEIVGDAKSPFIIGVKFIDCTIIADDLKAFIDCHFDETCTMNVKSVPLSGIESINNNAVFCEVESEAN